jgi:hypothetical protein
MRTIFYRSIICAFLSIPGAVLGDESQPQTALLSENVLLADYYDIGMRAYKEEDFVSALKYLFAYRSANEGVLKQNESFLSRLDKAIEYCEKKLTENILPRRIMRILGSNEEPAKMDLQQTEAYLRWTRKMIELRALEAEQIRIEAAIELKQEDSRDKRGG